MRIERLERSSHKKGRILVFLEDGGLLKVTEQEVLDYGLRAGDELEPETLARLKASAGLSDVKASAADLIGKRAMSRRDLEKKLRDKGASEAESRYAAEWLEAIGAIDDAGYAAALVRHCASLGYGPQRVRQKLYEKGVPRELWDEAMEELPEASEQIGRFLTARLRGREPDERELKRLHDTLLRRGYSWQDVREALGRYSEAVRED